MRFVHLLLWDMKLQAKYGFYLLYGFLTVFYIILLFALPQTWQEKAAALLIFSDPAAMGLFFMGAIILLEKSQKLPYTFAVSPVSAAEYLLSKILSLGSIALIVAAVLALTVKVPHLPSLLLGTFLSGIMFTLFGIIIAAKIVSLNQFILWTVPIEILGFVPTILRIFHISPARLNFYPPIVCMDLITGNPFSMPGFLLLILLIILLFFTARNCILKMWETPGGIKL